MTNTTAQELREAAQRARRSSMPLSDLVPLMQKAADELDNYELQSRVAAELSKEPGPVYLPAG